jgi:hypothetical protein
MKKYECVNDLNVDSDKDGLTYVCGAKYTSDSCIIRKEGYCDFGYFDKNTNTIRCSSIDYLKKV